MQIICKLDFEGRQTVLGVSTQGHFLVGCFTMPNWSQGTTILALFGLERQHMKRSQYLTTKTQNNAINTLTYSKKPPLWRGLVVRHLCWVLTNMCALS